MENDKLENQNKSYFQHEIETFWVIFKQREVDEKGGHWEDQFPTVCDGFSLFSCGFQ